MFLDTVVGCFFLWRNILSISIQVMANMTLHRRKVGSNYVVYSISFQTLFLQAFKIIVDPWKFSM